MNGIMFWWNRIKKVCEVAHLVILALSINSGTHAAAQTLTTLVTFSGSNGIGPEASLTQGRDGDLYGTTLIGGNVSCNPPNGCGTVFKVNTNGALTTLYSFCERSNCADGSDPYGALALGTDGNLYGVTAAGGAHSGGTIFRITPEGQLNTLYSFCGQTGCTDGDSPIASLIEASNGDFYGTAYGGAHGVGTIFKITPQGRLTTLYSFCAESDCADGSTPSGGLVRASDGDLYGTTYSGGAFGYGTVFKIAPDGQLTTLQSLDFTNGANPTAGLVVADNGKFYGTTFLGGSVLDVCDGGCGTTFMINPSGALTTLDSLDWSNGYGPNAALIQATDGNLYGTTAMGQGEGTVFKMAQGGGLTTLFTFSGVPTGFFPYGGLLQATSGALYGTTAGDGVTSDGTVYSLTTGLGPFVAFVLPTGRVGATAQILGQGLTGTTSVTFNGLEATAFKVVSDTYMTAVVPSGATTGPVVVSAPTGPLTSNVNFRVVK